jgi:SET and MYND domain-containing protein
MFSSGAMAEMPSGVVCEALLVCRTLRELACKDDGKHGVKASDVDVNAMCHHDGFEDSLQTIVEFILGLRRQGSNMLPVSATATSVLQLLRQFECNNFGIMDDLLVNIGAGVYPFGALLNHACNPTCVLSYEGATLVIRTLKSLRKGAELTHQYVDVASPLEERQAKLQEMYGFQCRCELCEQLRLVAPLPAEMTEAVLATAHGGKLDMWDVCGILGGQFGSARRTLDLDVCFRGDNGSSAAKKSLQSARGLREQAAALEDLPAELDFMRRALRLQLQHSHWLNLDVIACHAELLSLTMLDASIAEGHVEASAWKRTGVHCAYLCEAYIRIYGPDHPMLGLQLCTLGELCLHKIDGQQRAGVAYIACARRILSTTHGKDSSIIQGLLGIGNLVETNFD